MDDELEKLLPEVTTAVTKAAGPALAGLLLYGSAVGGGYKPGKSNVNVLAVLRDLDTAAMKRLGPVITAWDEKVVVIHVTTTSEVRASAHIFPIHFLELSDHHKVLHGEDPTIGIVVEKADLAMSAEVELRGITRTLRRAVVFHGEERQALGAIVRRSFRAMVYALRGALRVVGDLPPTTDKHPTIERASKHFGLDQPLLLELLAFRRRMAPVSPDDIDRLAYGLLTEASKAADKVAALSP